jgi:hypothetical protein
MPIRSTLDLKSVLSPVETENTTLPLPLRVSGLSSSPTSAVKLFPGAGSFTSTLLTAWQ